MIEKKTIIQRHQKNNSSERMSDMKRTKNGYSRRNRFRSKDCAPLTVADIKLTLLKNDLKKSIYERTKFFLEERFGPGMRRNPNFENYIYHVLKRDFARVYMKKLDKIQEKYVYKYYLKGFTHNKESMLLTASEIMFKHFVDVFAQGSTSDGYGGIY